MRKNSKQQLPLHTRNSQKQKNKFLSTMKAANRTQNKISTQKSIVSLIKQISDIFQQQANEMKQSIYITDELEFQSSSASLKQLSIAMIKQTQKLDAAIKQQTYNQQSDWSKQFGTPIQQLHQILNTLQHCNFIPFTTTTSIQITQLHIKFLQSTNKCLSSLTLSKPSKQSITVILTKWTDYIMSTLTKIYKLLSYISDKNIIYAYYQHCITISNILLQMFNHCYYMQTPIGNDKQHKCVDIIDNIVQTYWSNYTQKHKQIGYNTDTTKQYNNKWLQLLQHLLIYKMHIIQQQYKQQQQQQQQQHKQVANILQIFLGSIPSILSTHTISILQSLNSSNSRIGTNIIGQLIQSICLTVQQYGNNISLPQLQTFTIIACIYTQSQQQQQSNTQSQSHRLVDKWLSIYWNTILSSYHNSNTGTNKCRYMINTLRSYMNSRVCRLMMGIFWGAAPHQQQQQYTSIFDNNYIKVVITWLIGNISAAYDHNNGNNSGDHMLIYAYSAIQYVQLLIVTLYKWSNNAQSSNCHYDQQQQQYVCVDVDMNMQQYNASLYLLVKQHTKRTYFSNSPQTHLKQILVSKLLLNLHENVSMILKNNQQLISMYGTVLDWIKNWVQVYDNYKYTVWECIVVMYIRVCVKIWRLACCDRVGDGGNDGEYNMEQKQVCKNNEGIYRQISQFNNSLVNDITLIQQCSVQILSTWIQNSVDFNNELLCSVYSIMFKSINNQIQHILSRRVGSHNSLIVYSILSIKKNRFNGEMINQSNNNEAIIQNPINCLPLLVNYKNINMGAQKQTVCHFLTSFLQISAGWVTEYGKTANFPSLICCFCLRAQCLVATQFGYQLFVSQANQKDMGQSLMVPETNRKFLLSVSEQFQWFLQKLNCHGSYFNSKSNKIQFNQSKNVNRNDQKTEQVKDTKVTLNMLQSTISQVNYPFIITNTYALLYKLTEQNELGDVDQFQKLVCYIYSIHKELIDFISHLSKDTLKIPISLKKLVHQQIKVPLIDKYLEKLQNGEKFANSQKIRNLNKNVLMYFCKTANQQNLCLIRSLSQVRDLEKRIQTIIISYCKAYSIDESILTKKIDKEGVLSVDVGGKIRNIVKIKKQT